MAGPSVLIRILGDLKNFAQSVADTAPKAEGAASKIHSAFSGMLGALNKTGILGPFSATLDGIDEAIGQIIEHGKKIGPALIGVGTAVVGVGAGLSMMGSKDQAAHQQLQAAVEATGGSYDDYAKQVEAAIKTQENYGHTADQTQNALTALTEATHDPAKALDLLATASDVAASKHEDLTTAAGQVGKVYNGNTKLLKEFGVTIDKSTGKTKDGKTATQALADVTKGQAAASIDTFTGKLDVMRSKLEDTVAEFGTKYGPAIQTVGLAIVGLGTLMTTVSTIMAADWFAAFWPIGIIVLTLAGLGVAIYELVNHFQAVIDWLGQHWQIIVEIIFGPFGLAFVLIYQHFQGVIDFFTGFGKTVARVAATMWHWISDAFAATVRAVLGAWNGLVAWFTGLPAGIARLAVGMWHGITDAFGTVLGALQGIWNGIVAWFARVPNDIASLASGMWHGITDAFRAALNALIDLWNQLHFTLPKIDVGPLHAGGETIGVPRIPHLAQGGLITADGLIYAHAGEAITPAPGRTGPAVVVQNAHFAESIDVDLFMRKAAWAVQTSRI